MKQLSALLTSFGVAIGIAACGGSDLVLPNETGPAALELVQGNGQSGPAGEPLGQALVVKVTDRRGEPVPNQQIAFTLDPAAPGSRVTPDITETDEQGLAEAEWVLGGTSGTQSVVAHVVGADELEVRFVASVGAAGAAGLAIVSGDDQTAPIGTQLPEPLIVRVTDGFGNPVAGVTVDWSAAQGSVEPTTSVTGDDGRATTSWTLGNTAGSQTATATSLGLEGSPVTFTARAGSGNAERLVRVSGNNQSARVGTELDDALVVRLTDAAGNGVPDRAVSWIVATGGGSVSSDNTTTDEDGRAFTRWTLGPNAGSNSLNAVVSGVGAVSFTATATDGGGGGGGGGGSSPSRLAFRVQPSDTEEDERISPPVEVVVLDEDGDLVTDRVFQIKLELEGEGRAKLKGRRDERTQSGVARFDDLRVDRDGEYRLRASTDGLPSIESDRFEVEED